jgi:hypothetical protein
MSRYASFGSISSGTMRPEDLIRTFSNELGWLIQNHNHCAWPEHRKLVGEANAILVEDYESEEASEILNELFEALEDFAPPYGYFGSHPGDGADYGFWLSEDFEQTFIDDGGLKVSDTGEVPDDYTGEVLHVNDHGNCTLYSARNGKLTEIWSVV